MTTYHTSIPSHNCTLTMSLFWFRQNGRVASGGANVMFATEALTFWLISSLLGKTAKCYTVNTSKYGVAVRIMPGFHMFALS